MDLVRPKARSYTVASGKRRIERALIRENDRLAPHPEYADDRHIHSRNLPDFLSRDFEMVIRQLASLLDKVIRKPRGNNLRNFHIDAYVDRIRLAREIWRRFENEHGEAVRASPGGVGAEAYLASMWRSRAHPYCTEPADQVSPRSDKNAEIIAKHGDKDLDRTAFSGRWHGALWRTDASGKADYPATASAIWEHLFVDELKVTAQQVHSKRRHRNLQEMPETPDRGLAQARGRSIARSTHHPATGPTRRLRAKVDGQKICSETIQEYFRQDVVKKIRALIFDQAMRADGTNSQLTHIEFGKLLYEHFGPIIKRDDLDKARRGALWDLHNAVRGFYQDLGRSERFQRSMRDPARQRAKLLEIVPTDCGHLLRILEAKDQNREISALTRLGKLIAHASDLAADERDPSAAFLTRLNVLQTSKGQNEIKRNEAFTRIWRTSVALSLRTLHGIVRTGLTPTFGADVDVDGAEIEGVEQDPAQPGYAKAAMRAFDAGRFRARLGLLLGCKPIAALGGQTRSSQLLSTEKDSEVELLQNKEVLWALLRLAGEIRHRTNHFNTKDRLIRLLTNCPLKGQLLPTYFDNRNQYVAHQDALNAFKRLLDFDIKLRHENNIEDFRRLKVNRFVQFDEVKPLLGELAKLPDATNLAPPKFINLLRHAKNLACTEGSPPPFWVEPFGVLDLNGLSQQIAGVNYFRVGMLRLLYASGFTAWLSERLDNKNFIRDKIVEVNAAKKERFESHYKGDDSDLRIYAFAETLADRIGLEEIPTLRELLHMIQTEATNDNTIHHTDRVNSSKRSAARTAVEDFRLDLFVRLFWAYLSDMNLAFIMSREAEIPAEHHISDDVLSELEPSQSPIKHIAQWHCQFYAWLYLVPADDLALLRQQLLKTRALETKAGVAPSTALAEIDRLMGLYLAVNASGFDGREHVPELSTSQMFFEGREDSTIADEAFEKQRLSLPGTLRGLRQLLRLDHHAALKKIFEKHKVTSNEVKECARLLETEVHQWQQRKADLKNYIVKISKQPLADGNELAAVCEEYRNVATQLALHNFRIAGARLTEFARLHQLMMRILARLADFCLMWERDRHYVFLGLLCQQIGVDRIAVAREGDGTVGLIIPEDLRGILLPIATARTKPAEQLGLPTPAQAAAGFLPLWHSRYGFVRSGRGADLTLLPVQSQALFLRYFGKSTDENPRDVARRKARSLLGYIEPPTQRTSFKDGKARIRNDFAHFNIIGSGSRLNLTYLTNAVRSLMAHDRKMKNAVSKAVTDIVAEAGLEIRWSMRGDRLQDPEVVPLLETHLSMVQATELRFHLPHASVRFTSMVKALFDFGSGGYRDIMTVKGVREAKGVLRYPAAFALRAELDEEVRLPDEILEQSYPALIQSRRSA